MQVIEVRMGDQNQIDRWKVIDFDARLSQALKHKQPSGKIGINDNVLASYLQKEAGMPNERHAHLAVRNQHRPVRLAGRRSHGGVANQASKLPGTLAQSRIFQGLL
jgi:hypothetical protein